ncbi:MAG: hypothetical protein QF415_05410 [Candidatus Undinarchaeales archaeon]|nr:hypothetical protein [Candidatus Undinarchaeales archaeon]MDP7491445.1 hypothetical protein [Candidatus Undinarchaeales archaeon]
MMTGTLDFVEAKRFESRAPKEVSINVNFQEITQEGSSNTYAIHFGFDVQYSPSIGYIRMKGTMMFEGNEADTKHFESTKRLPDASVQNVANSILQNCTVQTVMLSSMLKLPPPISLPSVNIKRPGKKPEADVTYIG